MEYVRHVSMECPRCHLPKEDSAWQCDGCGYEFTQDFAMVRATLQTQLTRTRIVFWSALIIDCGLVAGTVFLATHGLLYISVPLVLAAIGFTGRAAHRISVLRDHQSSLDRRHVPLPAATIQK